MRQARITATVSCCVLLVVWTVLPSRTGGRFADTNPLGVLAMAAIASVAVALVARPAPPARLGAVTGVAAAFGTFALIGPLDRASGVSVLLRVLIAGLAGGVVWTTLPARRWRAMLHQNELGLVMLGGGVTTVLLWALATRTSALGIVLAAGAFAATGYGVCDRGAWARWLCGGLVASLSIDLMFDPRGKVGVVGLLIGVATVACVVLAERSADEAPPLPDPALLDPSEPELVSPGALWKAPIAAERGAAPTTRTGKSSPFQRKAAIRTVGRSQPDHHTEGERAMTNDSGTTSRAAGVGQALLAIAAGVAVFIVCSIVQAAGGSNMFQTSFEDPDSIVLELLMQVTWWPGWIATVLLVGGGLVVMVAALADRENR